MAILVQECAVALLGFSARKLSLQPVHLTSAGAQITQCCPHKATYCGRESAIHCSAHDSMPVQRPPSTSMCTRSTVVCPCLLSSHVGLQKSSWGDFAKTQIWFLHTCCPHLCFRAFPLCSNNPSLPLGVV